MGKRKYVVVGGHVKNEAGQTIYLTAQEVRWWWCIPKKDLNYVLVTEKEGYQRKKRLQDYINEGYTLLKPDPTREYNLPKYIQSLDESNYENKHKNGT